jgi:hypothetical protein
MYLYFENYSHYLFMLDQKGTPHGDKIIKVYAAEADPRIRLGKPKLAVVESPDHPFSTEIFVYPGRETYTGVQIEEMINRLNLNEIGIRIVRALFRFSNRPDLEFCQAGMAIKNDRGWLIDNPLQDIDGLNQSTRSADIKSLVLHLDIFVPESLRRLDQLIHLNDPEHLVEIRDGLKLKGLDRGMKRGPERV